MGRADSGRGRAFGGRHSWRDVLSGEGSGSKPPISKGKEEERGFDAEDSEFYNNFSNPTLEANQIEEILSLNPSDHPGMQLVSAQLTGMNFLNWSRQARNQILLLEPLPTVDRAYAMIVQVEDELSLNRDQVEGSNMMAMNVMDSRMSQGQVFAVGSKGNIFKRRLTKEERRRLRCKHCHESGHDNLNPNLIHEFNINLNLC